MVDAIDIIGLDLSLTSTGVATERGTLTIKTKLKGVERLHAIWEEVWGHIAGFQNPYVVIEGYAFQKQGSHCHAQGELGGVVRHGLFLRQTPFVEVPPTVRSLFATGRGNAGKAEVVSNVTARSGLIFSSDDEADAWVLREMGMQHFEQSDLGWPAKNMTALEKVNWV